MQRGGCTPGIAFYIPSPDCTGDDKDASAREQINAVRTIVLIWEKMAGSVGEPELTGDAMDWLKQNAGQFSPVQINVFGDLVMQKEQSPPALEVVEGSAEELS